MLLDVGTNTPHYGLKLQAAFVPVFFSVFDLEGRICHKTVQNDVFFPSMQGLWKTAKLYNMLKRLSEKATHSR